MTPRAHTSPLLATSRGAQDRMTFALAACGSSSHDGHTERRRLPDVSSQMRSGRHHADQTVARGCRKGATLRRWLQRVQAVSERRVDALEFPHAGSAKSLAARCRPPRRGGRESTSAREEQCTLPAMSQLHTRRSLSDWCCDPPGWLFQSRRFACTPQKIRSEMKRSAV